DEFLFRGVVLGKLRFFGDSFALFMSSMVFALMHGNIIQIPFAFIVGLALAFLTVKTNSLLPSMAVHFIVNFRSVLLSIFIENNTISEAALNNIYLISLFVVFVLGIISAAILSKRKDFFKLESNKEYPFRYAVKHSILSVGMILFIVLSFINTLQTVSISWLDFSKYLF
ncbi:MAG: CPBP family intramembrane metalloprotease, partial [Ruminococcus sp.]|nr:CPBP family intramembrane metalloprotease [Ruminococcus sp.]